MDTGTMKIVNEVTEVEAKESLFEILSSYTREQVAELRDVVANKGINGDWCGACAIGHLERIAKGLQEPLGWGEVNLIHIRSRNGWKILPDNAEYLGNAPLEAFIRDLRIEGEWDGDIDPENVYPLLLQWIEEYLS